VLAPVSQLLDRT